jgi:hypothetical protein
LNMVMNHILRVWLSPVWEQPPWVWVIYLFIAILGVLTLLGKHSLHLGHNPQSFSFWFVFQLGSHTFAWAVSDHDLPTSASWVTSNWDYRSVPPHLAPLLVLLNTVMSKVQKQPRSIFCPTVLSLGPLSLQYSIVPRKTGQSLEWLAVGRQGNPHTSLRVDERGSVSLSKTWVEVLLRSISSLTLGMGIGPDLQNKDWRWWM